MGLAEEVASMTSGVLMISGSVLFLVGAARFVAFLSATLTDRS